MSTRPGHALGELMKWTARDAWRARVDGVMAEHFEPAMDAFGLTFEEIDDALGGGWAGTLWGCAFEDFLTRRFGPEEENPVEAYLRRRGWKERAATRAYMLALQGSAMSLYEVSDILPGQSFRARDLVRGGEPVTVTERTATRTLKPWDRIAARVVKEGERFVIGGGVLAFTLEGSERLFAGLRERGAARPRGGRTRKVEGARQGWAGTDEELRAAAPLFSTAWLLDVLPRALDRTPPQVLNSDGDEVVFHTVRFPLVHRTAADDAEARLGRLTALRRASPTFWNWIGPPAAGRPAVAGEKAVVWNVTLDDGSVVLGNVELKGGTVVLSVSSAARAERGRAMLANALAELVGTPLTEIQTIEQMRASAPPGGPAASEPPIPPEVQAELVHDMLDRQYRALLDEPVPMLGNRTPRAAARSARGRRELVVWLKHLENRSSHAPDPADPLATYDFAWIWQELGIAHLRG
ncbi:MAG: hypothetical protein M0Z28_02115 [Rhodospirillales bacterium]|nr:hypothetical protein [Rhodospirillales bacterium]